MVKTRHRPETSGVSDEELRQMIHEKVATTIRVEIPEIFGSIKTSMTELFNDRHATIAETAAVAAFATVAAAGTGSGWVFQYRDFDNMKLLDKVSKSITISGMYLTRPDMVHLGCMASCN